MALGRIVVRKHGEGFTIHFTLTGAYVECWIMDSARLITLHFFEGGGRDLNWSNDALRVLSIARHWQWHGTMPENVTVQPDRNTRSMD